MATLRENFERLLPARKRDSERERIIAQGGRLKPYADEVVRVDSLSHDSGERQHWPLEVLRAVLAAEPQVSPPVRRF